MVAKKGCLMYIKIEVAGDPGPGSKSHPIGILGAMRKNFATGPRSLLHGTKFNVIKKHKGPRVT